MTSVAAQILFLLFLIVLNGFFAMSEIAVVTARRSRLEELATRGDLGARAALELTKQPNRFLSAIQIGITMIGVLAGAFGEATLAAPLAEQLAGLAFVRPHQDVIALGIVVLAITYASLVIGELVPKRIALAAADRIASTVGRPMRVLAAITHPAIHLLSASTDLVLRLLRVPAPGEPQPSEEEIRWMIQQSTRAGLLHEKEESMMSAVLRLADRRVSSLMTPRRDVYWIDANESKEEQTRKIIESGHSRFPVCEGDFERTLGFVQAKDLLALMLSGRGFDWRPVLREPIFVPENQRGLRFLEAIRQTRTHLAMVVDEHGSLEGIVTPSDVLEAIVGDLEEMAEPQVVQREDGSWLVDGSFLIDDFKERFGVERIPEEDVGAYETVAGLIMSQLGRVPSAGDHFEWKGFRFEVVDMDGLRIDKVLVTRSGGGAASESGAGQP